ncbi:MAG: ZIP family metal transporter [Dehalococcoidales bacterium]|nr:ZIP family metal transporter [Dehalococcoidales bacterium]
MVWFYTLGSVAVVSLLSLVGIAFLSFDRERLERMLLFLISFAAGALAGDAFIHLIPEAFEELGSGLLTPLLIIGGMLAFFAIESSIHWRHCHIPTSEHHVHPVAALNLISESLHNFIDGVLIAASYMVSIPLGIATTVAVMAHEIPQEIGDFGVLVYAGFTIKKALLFNFAAALTAVIGAVIVLVIGQHISGLSALMLPITAGGFIYIAGSDIVPEIHRTCDRLIIAAGHFVAILLGIGLMVALVVLE